MMSETRRSSRQRTATEKVREGAKSRTNTRSRPPKDKPPQSHKGTKCKAVADNVSTASSESESQSRTNKQGKRTSKKARQRSESSIEEITATNDDVEPEVISEHESIAVETEVDTRQGDLTDNGGATTGAEDIAFSTPVARKTKKGNTKDLLTIFSDLIHVLFHRQDGSSEKLRGRWCTVCRDDLAYVAKHGKRKAFHLGSNSSCRQHIRLHYKLYQQRCAEANIAENDWAVPPEILEERRRQQMKVEGKVPKGQTSLDGQFPKAVGSRAFSRDDVLKSVVEFIVCDDQALCLADKATFRNCLVAMRPNTIKADIPSTHNVSTYIHNAFVEFLKDLKADIQSSAAGRVSTTMDTWSVEQTKASFLGITAHWIHISEASGTPKWELRSKVIAFRSLSGAHTGENLAHYFIKLCERAGIVRSTSSKLLCITADNASNNDAACNVIESMFHKQHIYTFDPALHRLPCLAHVLNLAITDVMSTITKIANIETATAIWEYDPSLPENRVLENSLDVIAAIRTVAIKIQCSGQRIEYFQTLQNNCGIDPALSIPLHSNIRWGTADGMLGRAFFLRQPINLFISSADELFGPITVLRRGGHVAKKIPWHAFTFKVSDWERVNDTRMIISDVNNLQQSFSSETHATLWRAIPALEEIQTAWEEKRNAAKYELYHESLDHGLAKISKYYNKLDEKPVYILAFVLHPYYKLDYIEMAWGGPSEQQAEQAAGNLHAKNWHDKALKVVEEAMQEYWKERQPEPQASAGVEQEQSDRSTLASEYDRHRRALIQKAGRERSSALGWSAELRLYLNDIADNVTKDMDIIAWWAKHASIYPTLALMARDVCAIPASSVPCERLFSAGGEIATDRRSHLGAEHFEQLQVLKHGWRHTIVDRTAVNSSQCEEHYLQDFQELYQLDEEFMALDSGVEVV